MSERKWIDRSQPQTLQGAVMLSYLNAALGLFFFLVWGAGISLILLALGVAAYFVANEHRWAYRAAVGIAVFYLLVQLISFFFISGFSGIINLLFAGVLVALLLHPQSREYQRIWFH
jgi:hypothetical protein